MSDKQNDHILTLGYTNVDDGIHVHCTCGVDILLGFFPTVEDAAVAEYNHLREVGDRIVRPPA